MPSSFQKHYQRLNYKQKGAVDTIYGPVLVIAGPGSGKTELLAVRIANILKETDANPNNILCITFTEAAARNMRNRLQRIIGQAAYHVGIFTFHGFGLEVLNRFRYRIQEDEDLTPIDDIETSRIFHEIIQTLPWNHPWKKKTRLHTLKNTIGELKKAGITPEDFQDILLKNDQILNNIRPILEKSSFFSLGQKKEEKLKKVADFHLFRDNISQAIAFFPSEYKLQETLGAVLLRSLDEAISQITSESDTKPITAWRTSFLEKHGEHYLLKDEEKQHESTELLALYVGYEHALKERSLIDFSDMILRAIRLIETDEIVRATLAEQYQWIMIDEYQDTNDAQLRLITSLLEQSIESPNIFAVGDDDQSIYKFQGANTRNIRLFHDRFPGTKLIILEENYRSLSNIIEISRSIMINSSHSLDQIFPGETKNFHAYRGGGGDIELRVFESEAEELIWVSRDIEQQIAQGIPPNEIAVITKKNETLEYIAKLLLEKHISVALSKEENIFSDEIVVLIINILLYIDSLSKKEDRDELLVPILSHPMWGIHRLTLWEISRDIFRAKKEKNKEWIEVLLHNSDNNISKIARFFIELSLRAETERLETVIDIVTGANELTLSEEYNDEGTRDQSALIFDASDQIYTSPLYAYYFSEKALSDNPTRYAYHLANVRKLIESIRSYRHTKGRLSLRDFSEYIALIQEYEVSLSTSSLIGDENAVQCITAHKAKGLEYAHVYAIGLTEKQYKRGKNSSTPLPRNLPLTAEKDDEEDIRRLVYTVLTRAKDRLILTYGERSLDEKENTLLSVVSDISPVWQKNEQTTDTSAFSRLLELEYQDISSLPFTGDEQDFLSSLIDARFSLSATALQNFLDVSSGGPASFLANNVLRFPQSKSNSASYGTAMHKALEDFFRDYKIKGSYKKEILFESFSSTLKKEGLDEVHEQDMLMRGQENLMKLYEKISGREYGEIHLEYRFNDTYLDDIRITGAIDRIELTLDNKMIITDYKTGSGFSTLDGGSGYEAIKKWKYRLQLAFYAILFEQTPRWQAWQTREFRLFFVEQDRDTGEFYEVIEYIHEGEIERLKSLITIVMTKIRNLDFPDITQYEQSAKGIRAFEDDLLNGQI